MLPHVGQATSLSCVWLRMCSLRRYLILKNASQPVTETGNIDSNITKNIFELIISHTCPVAEESLLLLWERLWLGTFNVIVNVSVEPLRIVECTL